MFESGDLIKAGHVNHDFPYDNYISPYSNIRPLAQTHNSARFCVCVCMRESVVVMFNITPVTFVITSTQAEQAPHILYVF